MLCWCRHRTYLALDLIQARVIDAWKQHTLRDVIAVRVISHTRSTMSLLQAGDNVLGALLLLFSPTHIEPSMGEIIPGKSFIRYFIDELGD